MKRKSEIKLQKKSLKKWAEKEGTKYRNNEMEWSEVIKAYKNEKWMNEKKKYI